MRRFGGAALALSVIAVACAATPDPPAGPPVAVTVLPTATVAATSPPATAPAPTTTAMAGKKRGGEVIIADDQEPPTLNPYAPGGDNFVVRVIGQAHLTRVWDIDATTRERIPEVVAALPTVANGGVVVNDDGTMTVRYEIRDEAVWADGVPISGDDFQFTYETIIGADFQREFFDDLDVYNDIVGTEVGDKTFSFTTAHPTIRHESLFDVLIPRHDVEGSNINDDWNDRPWVAGGPFILEDWQRGESLTLTRNPSYWKTDPETGAQLPYLDRVVFRFLPETERIMSAFRNRDVDVIQPPPWIEGIATLQSMEPDGAAVTVRPGPVWEHLNFQFGPGRLDRNPDSMNEHLLYRQAVAHLVDRDAIATDLLAGRSGPLNSYIEAFTPTMSTTPWQQYDGGVHEAQRLLGELCADLGRDCDADPVRAVFSTTSNAEARPRIAAMLVDMFAYAGVELELQLEDSQLFFGEALDNGAWDLGEWAWVGTSGLAGLVSIHDVFDPESLPPDGSNFYRWGTPDSSVIDEHTTRFAELRELMSMTVDEAELLGHIQEAERILADQAVIIPLYARLTVGAVWADEIGGYEFNPTQAGHTWNIEQWHRTAR